MTTQQQFYDYIQKSAEDDRQDDFKAFFHAILDRIKTSRKDTDEKVNILDSEINTAIQDYCHLHERDFIFFGDD